MRKIIGIISGITGVLFSVPAAAFLIKVITLLFNKSVGIGIIGGADGPTAVFLTTSKPGLITALVGIILLLGIACIIVSAVLLKKKK